MAKTITTPAGASALDESVLAAMNAMKAAGRVIAPARGRVAVYHAAKYRVFHRLHTDFVTYRELMSHS